MHQWGDSKKLCTVLCVIWAALWQFKHNTGFCAWLWAWPDAVCMCILLTVLLGRLLINGGAVPALPTACVNIYCWRSCRSSCNLSAQDGKPGGQVNTPLMVPFVVPFIAHAHTCSCWLRALWHVLTMIRHFLFLRQLPTVYLSCVCHDSKQIGFFSTRNALINCSVGVSNSIPAVKTQHTFSFDYSVHFYNI